MVQIWVKIICLADWTDWEYFQFWLPYQLINTWRIVKDLEVTNSSLSSIRIFSVSTSVFLCLETLESTSALHLEAALNSEIINKKGKNVKSRASNRSQEGQSMRAVRRRQSTTLFDFRWECVYQLIEISHCSMLVCKQA